MSTIANDFIDFSYCGHTLSEYHGFIGEINGTAGVAPVEIGSVLSLNPVELKPIKKRKSVVATYDSYVEKQFSFFKNICEGDSSGFFSRSEVTEIIRWLNQPRYEKFTPIYTDPTWPTVSYWATFNVQPIIYLGNVIGFQLDMTTNAPFGYYDEVTVTGTDTLTIEDMSDEQGFIYPKCTITINTDGHLILFNSKDSNEKTIISNCVAGETFTLNGETGTIYLSPFSQHENLQDDFNYVFPKIYNVMSDIGIDDRINVFTTNLQDTQITMKYRPISKFGLI